jgi:DUF4097 and DUF4098 domain-containing protein YvlB
MIEVFDKNGVISIETKSKNRITLNTNTFEVKIDDLNVVHP